MKTVRARIPLAAVAAAALFLALAPPARAAGLLIADGGFGGSLEIAEHTAKVTINNGVAVTEVNQVFRNLEDRTVEALYVFPVPRGASVAGFTMWINGTEMTGEVVEKKRARDIYDSYKRVNRDPGLLEQADFRTFEMRIFPIAARAEQRVRITYYQELDFDADWATYVYPLATQARPGASPKVTGTFGITVDVKSEVPIVGIESPSHGDAFVVAKHDPRYAQASLEARGASLNRDVVVAIHAERARTGVDLVASKPPGEDGYFCLTLTAGDELAVADEGMDYVFVLDVSGSMADDGKLNVSRDSLGAFVRSLGDKDRFEIVAFNIQANALFRSLKPADAGTKKAGGEFLDGQRAAGGTILTQAVGAAYRYKDPDRTLNVVVMSDGMTEDRDRPALARTIQARPSGVRVFCIGVGNDVDRNLLQQLAESSGGLAAFVSRGDDFSRQAAAFRRKLLRPAASNVSIRFEGGDVYDVEPRETPNLFHGAPVRVYGRFGKSGKVKVHVQADLGSTTLDQVTELALPSSDAGNAEIERMWALKRIDGLLREGDRAGSREPFAAEIVRLGEGYSIVTEYTSFLVLENDGEYQRWKIDRRNQRRTVREKKGQDEVAAQLDAMRSKAVADVGPEAVYKVAPEPAANVPTPGGRNWTPPPGGSSRSSGGGSGAGALDPFSVLVAAGLGGLALLAKRRKAA